MDTVADALVTVEDHIRWGASRFEAAQLHFGHGTDNAIDEAAALVFAALDLPHDAPPTVYTRRVDTAETRIIEQLFTRRIRERKPAAYLTGKTWFAGLEFMVDERVLIPRSPIAELIERAFEPWLDPNRVRRVLDIGTGSACIAIACAHAFPAAHVDAVDISETALQVARENVRRHNLGSRVRLARSDLFRGSPGEPYDLIVSNPPYVAPEELSQLPTEYSHEPEVGLLGGEDGLRLVERILTTAGRYLTPDGILVVEVGEARTQMERVYPALPFTWVEFVHGEADVFLLTRDQLQRAFEEA